MLASFKTCAMLVLILANFNAITPLLDCQFVPESKSFSTYHPSGAVLKFIVPAGLDSIGDLVDV